MAISKATEYSTPYFTFTCEDTDADATLELVDHTPGTFFVLYADNTANASTQVYVKLWDNDATSEVTLGSTAPIWIFPIAGGKKKQFNFPEGFVYSDGLCMACVTSGGTEGTTGPSNDVIVRIGLTT
jgi:hypothetical protein